MTIFDFDDREEATLRAALRCYGEHLNGRKGASRFMPIASNDGAFVPLEISEVEDLADRFAANPTRSDRVAQAVAGTSVRCPLCNCEPRGTLERIYGIALIFKSRRGRFHHAGETEVDWASQHTLSAAGLPILQCDSHHRFTHPDFEVT